MGTTVSAPTWCGRTYETGVKVTDAQMRELRITPNSAMPKWNYTIEPM